MLKASCPETPPRSNHVIRVTLPDKPRQSNGPPVYKRNTPAATVDAKRCIICNSAQISQSASSKPPATAWTFDQQRSPAWKDSCAYIPKVHRLQGLPSNCDQNTAGSAPEQKVPSAPVNTATDNALSDSKFWKLSARLFNLWGHLWRCALQAESIVTTAIGPSTSW